MNFALNVNRLVSMVTGWLPTISRNWMLGTSIAVFLAILFLPSICDETYMPAFLTLSVHHKVIAAYVLGKSCIMSCSDFCNLKYGLSVVMHRVPCGSYLRALIRLGPLALNPSEPIQTSVLQLDVNESLTFSY